MCLIWRNWINKAQESTKQCAERGKIIQTSLRSKAFYTDWKHTHTNFCLLTRANLQILASVLANIPVADWGEFGVHMVYWPLLLIFQLYWSWVEGRRAGFPEYDHTCTKGLLPCGSVPGEKGDRLHPALTGSLAVQHTEDWAEKHTAYARASGEPEQSRWRILCSSEGFISSFQPERPHSCLQEDKQDNQSQIHFHKTLPQSNSLGVKGAVRC